jgi:chromatin structure-remodeling complex subunit RSC4
VNPLLARTLPARSVSPPHRLHHPLQEVSLKIEPRGRPLRLDHSDGVKSWAIKLGHGEKALVIINVSFLLGEEEESSADEEEEERKEEEEEEEHDVEADVPVKNGRKKGKGRGRGRPRGSGLKAAAAPAIVINVAEKSKVKKAKKTAPSMDDVQVKLDGTQVNAKEEGKGEWYVELPVGLHVVEVGAKGGMVWKVFAERMNE